MKKSLMVLIAVSALTTAGFAADMELDASHTFIWFKVNHLGMGDTMGQFRQAEGRFDLEAGTLQFKIPTASVDTNDAKRDEHLKGPDFFNVKQFPFITFKSTKVAKTGDNRYAVTGTLLLHGKKQDITVDVTRVGGGTDPWGNTREGISASFTLKRSDFGMNYMIDGIGDEVSIQFAAEGLLK